MIISLNCTHTHRKAVFRHFSLCTVPTWRVNNTMTSVSLYRFITSNI